MRVLLDTNVVSELRKGRRCHRAVAAWQSGIELHAPFLSVVTLLELRLGIALKARKDQAAGDVLLDWYEKAVKPTFAGRILGVDERIAGRCALLQVPVTKPYRDSLIAATAAEHGLIAATRNLADFQALGVEVVNPWTAPTSDPDSPNCGSGGGRYDKLSLDAGHRRANEVAPRRHPRRDGHRGRLRHAALQRPEDPGGPDEVELQALA
ncbi:MAG TPA: type II toxin-antitoxin system VapC family toxin [Geminicoccaceae bacterium]|nr:type II toxin-antitoxin system VapC family toxin [Geminicoccaceae bacterium]